jgi:hypothetical protein
MRANGFDIALLCPSVLSPPTAAAENAIPDFSGLWGSNSLDCRGTAFWTRPHFQFGPHARWLARDQHAHRAITTIRPVAGDWPEVVCAENPRMFGTGMMVPMSATPDF